MPCHGDVLVQELPGTRVDHQSGQSTVSGNDIGESLSEV